MTHTAQAANGHMMEYRTDHTNKLGERVWDGWTALHSEKCPCLTVENGDW